MRRSPSWPRRTLTKTVRHFAVLSCVLGLCVTAPAAHAASTTSAGTVTLTGGYDLVSVDRGRPTFLYDGALGVPLGTYRRAFAKVNPAADHDPSSAQQQANHALIMAVLAPYGITGQQLDRVANYYRFDSSGDNATTNGQSVKTMWPHRSAVVKAIVVKGKVTGFTIVDPGFGYQEAPTLTVAGYPHLKTTVKLAYSKTLTANGRIASITVVH